MFKIKLLILLLSSVFILSCSADQKINQVKLSVGYIGGEYDGLLLHNQLRSHLNNLGMLDEKSKYQIQASISHSSNVFVTNIDNTSDREKIKSFLDLKIYNKDTECYSYTYSDNISQFYILAPSDSFGSNKIAVQKIKFENTEYFVKDFINDLTKEKLICD
mgnify:CR=1 FL=1|tara:strand:+ start:466 stop:948 length:483 start_codon:yes stop_codon:yes gene_type:complete